MSDTTPMMVQYLAIKAQYPDDLVFYRMGDFYELFFEDAEEAAAILDITLTQRGLHRGRPIPMCGVPCHSYAHYLDKLIASGRTIAICEQMESPLDAKKRGPKSVVRREVVRLITPGTVSEEGLLESREHHYLGAISPPIGPAADRKLGVSWCDMTDGSIHYVAISAGELPALMARIQAREWLVAESAQHHIRFGQDGRAERNARITVRVDSDFSQARTLNRLDSVYGACVRSDPELSATPVTEATGALLDYLFLTQCGKMPSLAYPTAYRPHLFMRLDASTRRHLEISHGSQGTRRGSLLETLDCTMTSPGGRLLAEHLLAPLLCAETINERWNAVTFAKDQEAWRELSRQHLQSTADAPRALVRLSLGRGSWQDLWILREHLRVAERISHDSQSLGISQDAWPRLLQPCLTSVGSASGLRDLLDEALSEPQSQEGAALRVRHGFHLPLDMARSTIHAVRQELHALREAYRTQTGVASLKIEHNNILGYYIEVSPSHASKLNGLNFEHRQTLGSCVRFGSEALRGLEQRLIQSQQSIEGMESHIFDQLVHAVLEKADDLRNIADRLAWLDVVCSHAVVAIQHDYVRPIVDHSLKFSLVQGRHPLFASSGRGSASQSRTGASERFVANDCCLEDDHRLWLLTGPNMAGKSTLLRQIALLTVMAQAGCFVPAESFHFGIVDAIFCRVGSGDDMARGQSTFMVEMIETAAILHHATARSLVVMDEIGRGTSTFDGVAIASACLEYLMSERAPRGLCATHFHELTALAERLPGLACYHMKTQEWQGTIVFLYEVAPGSAGQSFGLHVAKLAGLPDKVVARASVLLNELTASDG